MLGSVATLMHESYLAVYLTDVLHMSHTQVRAGAHERRGRVLDKQGQPPAAAGLGRLGCSPGFPPPLLPLLPPLLLPCPSHAAVPPAPRWLSPDWQPAGRGAAVFQGQRQRERHPGRRRHARPVRLLLPGQGSRVAPSRHRQEEAGSAGAARPAALPSAARTFTLLHPAPPRSLLPGPLLPASFRMVILGAALTAANKPMYAASGAVAALAGTTACLWWVTFAKVRSGQEAGGDACSVRAGFACTTWA